MPRILINRLVPLFTLLIALAACDPLIDPFTEEAYKNATNLKAQSLALISKSGEPYSRHREVAEELLVNVDAAYEYANGRPRNTISTHQWSVLRDPNGNLLGGFLRKWRTDGTINEFVRNEIGIQVESAFDTIICVEINKKEASSC